MRKQWGSWTTEPVRNPWGIIKHGAYIPCRWSCWHSHRSLWTNLKIKHLQIGVYDPQTIDRRCSCRLWLYISQITPIHATCRGSHKTGCDIALLYIKRETTLYAGLTGRNTRPAVIPMNYTNHRLWSPAGKNCDDHHKTDVMRYKTHRSHTQVIPYRWRTMWSA